jgi:hypothetical protein
MNILENRTVRGLAPVDRGLPAEVNQALYDARRLRGRIRRLLAAARIIPCFAPPISTTAKQKKSALPNPASGVASIRRLRDKA